MSNTFFVTFGLILDYLAIKTKYNVHRGEETIDWQRDIKKRK